jgi:hypothetical protein
MRGGWQDNCIAIGDDTLTKYRFGAIQLLSPATDSDPANLPIELLNSTSINSRIPGLYSFMVSVEANEDGTRDTSYQRTRCSPAIGYTSTGGE